MSYYSGWNPPEAFDSKKVEHAQHTEPTDDPRYLIAAVMPERDFMESQEYKLKVGVSLFEGACIKL